MAKGLHLVSEDAVLEEGPVPRTFRCFHSSRPTFARTFSNSSGVSSTIMSSTSFTCRHAADCEHRSWVFSIGTQYVVTLTGQRLAMADGVRGGTAECVLKSDDFIQGGGRFQIIGEMKLPQVIFRLLPMHFRISK